MMELRNSLSRAVAFLFEVGAGRRLGDEAALNTSLPVAALYGKSGKKVQRRGRLSNMRWIESQLRIPGSGETGTRAITARRG